MILLLGSHGQLGRDLLPLLPGEVVAWSRADADLVDTESVRQKLLQLRPQIVINCAAYNFVDKAEAEPDAAFRTNAFAARNLAIACRDLEATFVHFSTDYVFGADASRQSPWSETDAPGPVSVYGTSKLCGEYFASSICPRHFVIRTCGLYGAWGSGGKGGNFVETMLRVAGQGKALRVVDDQHCTPSSTKDVAAATVSLIETTAYGLYHMTNSGACSWHEFAAEIFRLAGLSPTLSPIPSSEYVQPAKRPPYSVLSTRKLAELGIPLRPWREALADYLFHRIRNR